MKTHKTSIFGACLVALALTCTGNGAVAQSALSGVTLPGEGQANVTYGRYFRFELGQAMTDLSDAYWHPHGYPDKDPQVNFDLSASDEGYGAVAYGFDWMNGWRADVGLYGVMESDVSGPCLSASNDSDCAEHAYISSASVSTIALMANATYSPLEAMGKNTTFNPFITAGLGFASNSVGEWTRTNDNKEGGDRNRTFHGDTNVSPAFNVGIGAALQLSKPNQWPVLLEVGYKYFYFGEAAGSPVPTDNGHEPQTPLTFKSSAQVLSIGLRIPLQKL